MLAPDVSVLVSAFRADAPDHVEMREWLELAVADVEPVGISDAVLGATVRIVTSATALPHLTPLQQG